MSDTAEVERLKLDLQQRDAIIASLRASLDDAYREIARFSGEKHARDEVIHEAVATLERLHRQESGK